MFKKYRPYIIFIGLICLGLVAIFLISSGYYPILSVNSRLLSARRFWKDYQANAVYYQNLISIYGAAATLTNSSDTISTAEDLKVSVLNKIIENSLISEQVKKELGADAEEIIQNKIKNLENDEVLKIGAQKMYGLSYDDFKNEILIPKAEQEILAGRLFLKGDKLENWLLSQKKSSRVKLFSSEFYWDGLSVKQTATPNSN